MRRKLLRMADVSLWEDDIERVWPICSVCQRKVHEFAGMAKQPRLRHEACRASLRATNTIPPRNRADHDIPAAEIERIIAATYAHVRRYGLEE